MITAEITLRREDGSILFACQFDAMENFGWDTAMSGPIVEADGNLALFGFAYRPSVMQWPTNDYKEVL